MCKLIIGQKEEKVECLRTGLMTTTRNLNANLVRERQHVVLPQFLRLQRKAQRLPCVPMQCTSHCELVSPYFNEEGLELISQILCTSNFMLTKAHMQN